MAFKTKLMEEVEFGEISEIPQLTTELRMRLDRISFKTESDTKNAIEILASAFPVHKTEIIEYLSSPQMPTIELSRLRAYLTGGDAAVAALDNSFNIAIEKAIDKNA